MTESRTARLLRTEWLGLAVILAAIALLLVVSDVLQRWDGLIYDAQTKLLPVEAPSQIVLVDIDDESLAALGRWPWPRDLHARLIERLTEARAAVIGIDVLFNERDARDPDGDRRLADAIAEHGQVVLPVAPIGAPGSALAEALPLSALGPAALGHVDVELETDGIVRRACRFAGLGTPRWPSLPLAMWSLSQRQQVRTAGGEAGVQGARRGTWRRAECSLVPFVGTKDRFERVPFARVLDAPAGMLSRFEGRLVLVGATATGVGTAFATPLSGLARPMSGVEFNANVLAGLVQGTAITPLNEVPRVLLTLAFALVPALVLPRCRPRGALFTYALMLLAVLLASLALLWAADLWFAPAAALAAVALSYPLWSWRRLEATVGQLRRERNQARATLNAIGDGVVTTDRAGHVVYMNPVAEALTGFTQREAHGLPLTSVMRTFDESGERPVPPPTRACLEEGDVVQADQYVLLRAGSEWAIRWSGAPVRDAEGRIDGMVLAFSDITQILSLSRDMVHMATHDALTGLPNRVLMNDRVELALARARRAGEQIAVMFVDLDGFKRINDALGHSAGDTLLREVAARLRASCREEDSVARWGGDEFIVMLEKLHTRDAVVRRASHLLELLAKPLVVAGEEVCITASVGVCLGPRDGEDVETLLAHADLAMYRAKEEGRNGFRFYSPRLNGHTREILGTEKALRAALRAGELVLHYQPVIELGSGRLKGVEALIRWPREAGQLMLPKAFLPVVEQSDMVHAIGDWVLRSACSFATRMRKQGHGDVQVAVNLSPRQLLKIDLYARIATILEETGAVPSQLVLEVAEDLFLHDSKGVVRNLESIRGLGLHVAIDDFGTGYSSIGYLKYLPIDQIKIDHSFVQDGAARENDATIVRGIVSLARNLKLEIVAEGVESERQLEFVRSLDVDGVQGFYLAQPMPEAALQEFVVRQAKGAAAGALGADRTALGVRGRN